MIPNSDLKFSIGDWMSGRPASIRSRDVKQIIIGAKRAGAERVEFHVGAMPVIIYPGKDGEGVHVPPAESNNSFDRIMRDK
jgi:hypothetical protein